MDSHDRELIIKTIQKTTRQVTSVPYFDENRPVIYHCLMLTHLVMMILMLLPVLVLEGYPYFTGVVQARFANDPVIDSTLSFTNQFFTLTPVGSDAHLSILQEPCQKETVFVNFKTCAEDGQGPPAGSLSMRCRGYSLDENEVMPIFEKLCSVCKETMSLSQYYCIATIVLCTLTIRILMFRSSNLQDSLLFKLILGLMSLGGIYISEETQEQSEQCHSAFKKINIAPFEDELTLTSSTAYATSLMSYVTVLYSCTFATNLLTRHLTSTERENSLAEMQRFKRIRRGEQPPDTDLGTPSKKNRKQTKKSMYAPAAVKETDEDAGEDEVTLIKSPVIIKRKSTVAGSRVVAAAGSHPVTQEQDLVVEEFE